MKNIIKKLEKILNDNNVCVSHGLDHALIVMEHARKALQSENYNITPLEYQAVLLAALLHDADDNKFFPNNKNHENVNYILEGYDIILINLVTKMIDLVSSSKNADRIPNYVIGKEWLLIPRYADRLEALGVIGIERCYQYNITINCPLYTTTTSKAKTETEIWKIATEERYNNYNGKSLSMIDQYYDKLLRLGFYPIKNTYLQTESKLRRQIIIDFILYFGNKETFGDNDIIEFINKNKI